jgi:hypothetical protein
VRSGGIDRTLFMSFVLGNEAPWGLLEWVATGLSTAVLGSAAFVWRLAARLDRTVASLEWQKAELAAVKHAHDGAALRLTERLTQLHDDQCRLRETAAALPTRAELRDMEERLGERFEALAARIDGIIERGET